MNLNDDIHLLGYRTLIMKKTENITLLLARILMTILFITAGWGKLMAYSVTQQNMQHMGIAGIFLPLVILLELGGGIAILLGFLTRFTAWFIAGFSLLTAILIHSHFAEGVNQIMFMKNISIAGGFLLLAITGPGALSIDYLTSRKK